MMLTGLKGLRQSLISKFTVSTCFVLLSTIALFAYFNISTLKNIFLHEAKSDVETLSEIILHTTHHQMLEDNRIRVYEMMEEVVSHDQIELIRLLSKDGLIHFSTNSNEIGKTLAVARQECEQCHCEKVKNLFPPLVSDSRTFRNCKGDEILGVTTEIYNKASCSAASCHVHPPGEAVLGILEVQGKLDKVGVQAGMYRNEIITFAISMLLIVGISLTWLTQNLVIQPVRSLLLHARKVSKMDLDSQIRLTSKDEIGDLSEEFNTMTMKLKQARDEYKELTETLEAKVVERTEEIAQVNDQLIRSEKLASLGQLVAGIAHEINNPLAGILMFANIFADDERLDINQREDAKIIVRETQRCANIVKRLLDFSRTSIPDKRLKSMTDLMDNTLALVENHASVNDIEITRFYDDGLPDIYIDPTQIEQVFLNLVVNACQAMSAGGRLVITMRADHACSTVVTTIEDTGHGISDEDISRIFDPFFTTKELDFDGGGGTGLGLSVSYGIVENHGGRIGVQSVVGEGTIFTLELPMVTIAADRFLEEEVIPPEPSGQIASA